MTRTHHKITPGCIIIAVTFLYSYHAYAAAWNRPVGEWQAVNTYFYYSTDEAFAQDGSRIDQGEFTKHENILYAEYGYTEDITLGGTVSLQYLKQDLGPGNGTRDVWGVGDTEWFVRYQFWQSKDIVMSFQPLLKLPPANQPNDQLDIGTNQTDIEARWLLGHTYEAWDNYHFNNLEVAYRKRFSSPADELRIDMTAGIRPYEDWMVMAQLFSTFAVNGDNDTDLRLVNSNDFDLVKAQLSIVKPIDDALSLQFGLFEHVDGNNTGAGGGFLLSLWAHF